MTFHGAYSTMFIRRRQVDSRAERRNRKQRHYVPDGVRQEGGHGIVLMEDAVRGACAVFMAQTIQPRRSAAALQGLRQRDIGERRRVAVSDKPLHHFFRVTVEMP